LPKKLPFFGLLNPFKKSPSAFKKSLIGKKLPNLVTLKVGINQKKLSMNKTRVDQSRIPWL
jgi:hypothetical protein